MAGILRARRQTGRIQFRSALLSLLALLARGCYVEPSASESGSEGSTELTSTSSANTQASHAEESSGDAESTAVDEDSSSAEWSGSENTATTSEASSATSEIDDSASEIESTEIDSSSDMGSSTDSSTSSTSSTLAPLKISFETLSYSGSFAPRNIGAVWVETETGQYVRTVDGWSRLRLRMLDEWIQFVDGDPNARDAISGATAQQHGPHVYYWDRMDYRGKMLSTGEFAIRGEMTEEAKNNRYFSIPFSLLQGPRTFEAADVEGFAKLRVEIPE